MKINPSSKEKIFKNSQNYLKCKKYYTALIIKIDINVYEYIIIVLL